MLNNSNENNGLALEYSAILNSESVYVWLVSLCDEEFSVTRKSRGIEKIFKDEKSIDETLISTFDHQYREALKTGKNVLRKMFKVNDEYININFDPVVRDGKASEVVAVADITTREKVLIGENKDIALEYESLFQTTLNAMLILRKEDEKYIIERANDVFCNFRDIIPGSEVGVPLDDIYDEKDASRIKVNIDESIKNKKPISYRFTTKLGQFNVFVTPVIIKDEVKKVITTIVDETEERNKNEEIEFISYHDSLTGLYNRRYIDQYLEKLTREKKTNISAVMFDIDGLKLINDTFGNVEGDKLIKKAAETIKTVFDKCVVARWGGDEFVAIGLDLDYSYYAERMAKLEDIVFSVAEEDIKLSISIGYAVFDENTSDAYAIIKSAEESMYSQKFLNNDNLRNNYLELLKQMLFEKNYESKDHVNNMIQIADGFSERLNLSRNERNILVLAATLHDIGKLGINQQILSKPSKLTDIEYEEVKKHSTIGYKIAVTSNVPKDAALCILHHHERYDGTGYPNKLKGKDIPKLARMLTLIDSYEVMVRGRSYQPPSDKESIIKEIKRCSGTQFDPELAEIFIDLISQMENV